MFRLRRRNHKPELEITLYQRDMEKKIEEKMRENRLLFLNAMDSLVCALEAKDKYTAGHSRRVAEIAVAIGRELALPSDELEDLRWAALLHDIGKVAVDQAIQSKPGKLTPEEYQHMMIHVNVAPGIVKWVTNRRTVETIRHHHDHYGGSGNGQTTRGEEIPIGARIIAVADAYDAMTSDRPYRKAMSVNEALAEIEQSGGSQFDPMIVRAFIKTVKSEWWTLFSRMV